MGGRKLLVLIPLGLFLILVALFFVGLERDPKLVPSPLIGRSVPEFSLPRLRDATQTFQAADLKGQVSLVNVWATWCPACHQEHPMLLQIASTGEVPIYGLDYKDERQKAMDFLDDRGDPYAAVAFDADGRVGIDWGVYGAPETFVIDKAGVIRYKHIGPITPDVWQETLRPLVKQLQGMPG